MTLACDRLSMPYTLPIIATMVGLLIVAAICISSGRPGNSPGYSAANIADRPAIQAIHTAEITRSRRNTNRRYAPIWAK